MEMRENNSKYKYLFLSKASKFDCIFGIQFAFSSILRAK